ncbi:hypothetical protein ACWD04_06575 [Streptomyces sp. NPDC002911]
MSITTRAATLHTDVDGPPLHLLRVPVAEIGDRAILEVSGSSRNAGNP